MMGLFADLVAPAVGATYAPWENFWYQKDPRGTATEAGYPVTPDGAMRLSAVYACVSLIADMVGSLPLITYRRLDNEGKERATSNPLYNLLRRQPNPRQTAKEWLTMGTTHLLLRGNFYNRIVLDGRFAVVALEPLNPDRVKVSVLGSGRRGYLYRPPAGPDEAFTQDEIFHVLGLSLDGVTGCSVIEYSRETVGASLAQNAYAARFWAQGAEGHLAFVAPGPLSDKSRDENEKALQARLGGWMNAHKAVLLEGGLKPERISVTSRDSQYIESRKFSVEDLARFFRVHPALIGDTNAPGWGSGVEQLALGFVNFTLMPWLVTYEQSIDRDLILDERHFAEFLVDALLRGDMAARSQAYSIYVMNGIMSENEVRIRENLNPWPGLDAPQRSANQGRGGNPNRPQPPGPSQPPRAPGLPPLPPSRQRQGAAADRRPPVLAARAETIVLEAAVRLVRKEAAAVRKWAPRFAANPDGWRKWATEFYGRYAGDLEAALAMSPAAAREYCDGHRDFLLRMGVQVVEEWERDQPPLLAELALSQTTTKNGGRQ